MDTINSNMVNPIEKLAWKIKNNAVSEEKVDKINKKIDHIEKSHWSITTLFQAPPSPESKKHRSGYGAVDS